jgi:hypothetical protein
MGRCIRGPSMISAERSITDPLSSICRSMVCLTTLGAIVFSLSSWSPTTITSCRGWLGGGKDCCEDWDSKASVRSSSLAARERNDASMPSCPKYQSEPGSGGSSASGSVPARVGDNLIGATMVAPDVAKCEEVVDAPRLLDGTDGLGCGARRASCASGRGRRCSSLIVGGGGG